ncbi:MAG: hypothetical protein UHP11_00445 [Anaerovoracaceae bacterium]|nr:hypothetical protein [Anaerovoracaceae bacterium]
MNDNLVIRHATVADMPGIRALLKKYHRDTISDKDRPGGFVTTAITDEQLTDLIEKENGVMIIVRPQAAPSPDEVLAFCFAAPWEFWKSWPLFAYMIEIMPEYEFEGKKIVVEETYQYGPICVDTSIRGTGAFADLFYASLTDFKDRFPIMITFVNSINGRSENAHNNKAHMQTIGTFDFNDNHYLMMAIRTDHEK